MAVAATATDAEAVAAGAPHSSAASVSSGPGGSTSHLGVIAALIGGASAEGADDAVDVLIEAEDEDDRHFTWRCRVAPGAALMPMRRLWAQAHGVPEAAVGFEDLAETVVNLSSTPSGLGWASGKGPIHLRAIPVDESFCEAAPTPAAAPVQAASAALGASSVGGGTDGVSRANLKRARASPSPEATATATGGAKRLRKAPDPVEKSTSAAGASAASAASTGKPAGPGRPAAASKSQQAAGGEGKAPEGEEAVVWQQTNPKKVGSTSHVRYEQYKVAKTPAEAMRLGAAKGDVMHDFKKGLMKRA